MHITHVGVDIAKSVFQVHAADKRGKALWRAKLTRKHWLASVRERVPPGAVIAMEACGSAHHWARLLLAKGYTVKLISPQFVKPFVKSNKNDRADAEAICEALQRPGMRFVPVKSVAQQDVQAMHRIRDERVQHRTALANQIRGLVGEYGLVAPAGLATLRKAIPRWLEDAENGLTALFRERLSELYEDLTRLDQRVQHLDKAIAEHVANDPVATRLSTLRGIGPITASILSATLGDGSAFKRGKCFAASLGLTPRQHSSGGRERLLGISKRGDPYVRKLLVHGARAVIRFAKGKDDALSRWITQLRVRKPLNVVIVALANKTARLAWAVTARNVVYQDALAAKG